MSLTWTADNLTLLKVCSSDIDIISKLHIQSNQRHSNHINKHSTTMTPSNPTNNSNHKARVNNLATSTPSLRNPHLDPKPDAVARRRRTPIHCRQPTPQQTRKGSWGKGGMRNGGCERRKVPVYSVCPLLGLAIPGQAVHASPSYDRKTFPASAPVPATSVKLSCNVNAGVGSVFGLPKRRKYSGVPWVGPMSVRQRGCTKICLSRIG